MHVLESLLALFVDVLSHLLKVMLHLGIFDFGSFVKLRHLFLILISLQRTLSSTITGRSDLLETRSWL